MKPAISPRDRREVFERERETYEIQAKCQNKVNKRYREHELTEKNNNNYHNNKCTCMRHDGARSELVTSFFLRLSFLVLSQQLDLSSSVEFRCV